MQFQHVGLAAVLALSMLHTFQLQEIGERLATPPSSPTRVTTSSPPETTAIADSVLTEHPAPQPPARTGGTVHLVSHADPRGLNPLTTLGADVQRYATWVTDPLARAHHDDPGRFAPSLATAMVPSDDGRIWDIYLRRGVLWHEPDVDWPSGQFEWLRGDHLFHAEDLAFTLELIRSPTAGGRVPAHRLYLEGLENVQVIDDHHVRLTFDHAVPTHLEGIAAITPLPRWLYAHNEDGSLHTDDLGTHVQDHWYNDRMLGTGPYVFEGWTPGVSLRFSRNPWYWGAAPAFEGVVHDVVADGASVPRRLRTADTDIASLQAQQYRNGVQGQEDAPFGDEGLAVRTHDTLGYSYIGWNADTPWFTDRRVRLAMTLALDRSTLADEVFHGLATVTSGPFPRQTPAYDPSIQPWPYDLDRAAALLEEAGWVDSDGDGIRDRIIDGRQVDFDVPIHTLANATEWNTALEIYRQALEPLGVRLRVRPEAWANLLDRMERRDFAAVVGSWTVGWEPDLMQLWHSREADAPGGSNRIGFRNAEADRLAESLRDTADPQARTAIARRFHALVHAEQPYTFVHQRQRAVAYRTTLHEPRFNRVFPYIDVRHGAFVEAP